MTPHQMAFENTLVIQYTIQTIIAILETQPNRPCIKRVGLHSGQKVLQPVTWWRTKHQWKSNGLWENLSRLCQWSMWVVSGVGFSHENMFINHSTGAGPSQKWMWPILRLTQGNGKGSENIVVNTSMLVLEFIATNFRIGEPCNVNYIQ